MTLKGLFYGRFGRFRQLPTLLPTAFVAGGLIVVLCVLLWPPSYPMADLRVYAAAAAALVDGNDIYTAHHAYPGMGLGFTYPPFAAIPLAPLALVNEQAGRLAMTIASSLALIAMSLLTVRTVKRHWHRTRIIVVGLTGGVASLGLEPVRATFGLGQINLVLAALVMLDLLGPVPSRYRGALIGIATGIKLTPGIFILYLLVARRYRQACIATTVTIATMAIGWLAMPGPSKLFWTSLILDPRRPGAAHYISNQSLRGAITRFTADSAGTTPLWLAAALTVCCAGLFAARRAHDHARPLDAMVLTAVTGLLVSPISWTNHWVWAAPTVATLWCWTVDSHGSARAALILLISGWTGVMAFGLPWLSPFTADREFNHHGIDLLLGNSYTLAAITLLITAVRFSHQGWVYG